MDYQIFHSGSSENYSEAHLHLSVAANFYSVYVFKYYTDTVKVNLNYLNIAYIFILVRSVSIHSIYIYFNSQHPSLYYCSSFRSVDGYLMSPIRVGEGGLKFPTLEFYPIKYAVIFILIHYLFRRPWIAVCSPLFFIVCVLLWTPPTSFHLQFMSHDALLATYYGIFYGLAVLLTYVVSTSFSMNNECVHFTEIFSLDFMLLTCVDRSKHRI